MARAIFVTVEGIEGSGKSSVISFLSRFLRKKGFKVKVFREPGSTKIGEKIRDILLDRRNKTLSPHTELLLYMAARTQLIEEKLSKALSKYDFVICDRFFDSTLVYQGYAMKMGEIVDKSVKLFNLGVVPDLTIVLDTEVTNSLERIKIKDRIESRPVVFHRRLRDGYRKLARKYPQRIKLIDAEKNLNALFRDIESLITKYIWKTRIKR
ncbi:MAG: dTMP kinase [Candidatus Omnitrophica bacterium 4484_171]|nr:MAG: dTMP kinase [Candidatus Omnitrophica bacterium 4484_171]